MKNRGENTINIYNKPNFCQVFYKQVVDGQEQLTCSHQQKKSCCLKQQD